MKCSTPQNLALLLLLLIPIISFSQLSINEILADNEDGLQDESGDHEDWIEIYNGTNASINLAGYYLSDDPAEPLLWQIPISSGIETTVAAGGFLILFADKDISDGNNHINLKLGANGEILTLIAPDGIDVVDQFEFGPQSTDVSYGRTTDGGSDLQFFPSPTPYTSNESTSNISTFSSSTSSVVKTVNDDAIEYGVSSQGMNIDNYGMDICESWSNQKVGVRFSDLMIPDGAIITNAKIQFTAKGTSDGASDLIIKGELSDDANPFEEINGNISDRPTTNGSVSWNPSPWTFDEGAGPNEQTTNIASLIQEIIDNQNWESGNAMAFIITGSGERSAQNFTSGYPPSISIEMEIPVPSTELTGVYINEIAPNGTEFQDDTEDYADWIEIYNDNDFPVNLGGLYLSDKENNLTKWQIASSEEIPAKGFFTYFADEDTGKGVRHTNFKLSDDGEKISLVQSLNNELIILDSINYGEVPFKASSGRTGNGSGDWVVLGSQTPNASNIGALNWLDRPDFSLNHGVFNAPQIVELTHVDPDATIFFTTDNSIPDQNSTVYTGPITINETQSLRAIAYKTGFAPSQVKTKSYLFDGSATLPVLMISTDPDNLYDDEIGIYTVGTNGIELGNCSNNVAANFWQDWERPAHLTLFETSGDKAFSVNAGIKISGNCSRRYELKSLNIFLRNNQYGDNNIDYKLFPNRDFKKYDRLRLRNSGQDYRGIMMRDATNHSLLAEVTEVEYQNYQPAVVYINGEYFGIQNFRDLYGNEYFENFFDVEENGLDLIKSPRLSNNVKEGDDNHYNELYNFVENNDLSIPTNYEYFQTQFDLESFMDYWVSMIYMSSSDWPANNLQIWRPKTNDGKWRYTYLDTDATTGLYGFNSSNGHEWNTLAEVTDANQNGWPFDQRATLFFRKLLENEEFKAEYIQLTCSFIELILSESRAHQFIDASAAVINDEIGRHTERWAYDNPYLENYQDWFNKVTRYKEFFTQRPNYFYDHMENEFNLNNQFELSFNYDDNTNGKVLINRKEIEIPFNYTGTYYRNIPIRIYAEADEGYEFSHWLETGNTNATIDFVGTANQILTPIFEAQADVCNPDSPDFLDTDNDGVCDLVDQCPGFDDTVDLNGNGIPDDCEQPCPDEDNDGICDEDDLCPGFDDNIDLNNNGIPDDCEQPCPDEDNDSVCDDDDLCPGFDDNIDLNNNGIPDDCEQPCTDNDNDGICESDDCDDNNPALPAPVGSSCDDGNPNTENDIYLSNGCDCQGNPNNTGDYCELEGDFPWHEWIENVSINNINNGSRKSKYTDFTNIITSLSAAENYPIELTTGYSWATFDEYWNVWIDFNLNKTFEPTELVFSDILLAPANGTETGVISGTIQMPTTIEDGQITRMRVAMQRGSFPSPCGIIPFGEAEDYSVILSNTSPQDRLISSVDHIRVWPNPGYDLVNIKLPEVGIVSSVTIVHSTGQSVKRIDREAFAGEIVTVDVDDWQEGIYYIQVAMDRGKWQYAKLIVHDRN